MRASNSVSIGNNPLPVVCLPEAELGQYLSLNLISRVHNKMATWKRDAEHKKINTKLSKFKLTSIMYQIIGIFLKVAYLDQ